MSTKNKKSVVSQALLEMDAITSSIKEESKNTLNTLLAEAVRNVLREGCEEEEDKEYDIVDDDKDDADENEDGTQEAAKTDVDEDETDEMAPQNPQQEPQMPQNPAAMGGNAAQEAPEDMDGEGEEGWDEFSEYQSDDNTYDLTGENDYEKVVKVFKLLKDEDQVVVQKDDNMIHLKDDAAGTEYVIDLGNGDDESVSAESLEGEEMGEPEMSLNESEFPEEPAGFDSEFMSDDDDEFTFEFDEDSEWDGEWDDDLSAWDDEDEKREEEDSMWNWDGNMNRFDTDGRLGMAALGDDDDFNTRYARGMRSTMGDFDTDALVNDPENNLQESKKSRKPMKESKEVLFEVDLGYTDNYQDKDPIAGLSNNEPSKSGKSWHKGVPTGTKKPWAGETKSKGKPFGNTVNEEDEMPVDGVDTPVDEQKNVGGFVQQNSVTASYIPNSKGRKARNAHKEGGQVSGTADNRSTMAEVKALRKENKALKEAIIEIRKNLSEAYVTNANLGKITKLFLENTTSQAEKVDIVNRFSNEAKTIEQSKALYESIKRELSKTNPTLNINESKTAKGTQTINENKVYKSDDLLKTIDLMRRMSDF